MSAPPSEARVESTCPNQPFGRPGVGTIVRQPMPLTPWNASGTIRLKVRDLIRLLEADGWVLLRQRGSHRQFQHPVKPGTVTVAGKNRLELPRGTLNSVLKQALIRVGR